MSRWRKTDLLVLVPGVDLHKWHSKVLGLQQLGRVLGLGHLGCLQVPVDIDCDNTCINPGWCACICRLDTDLSTQTSTQIGHNRTPKSPLAICFSFLYITYCVNNFGIQT